MKSIISILVLFFALSSSAQTPSEYVNNFKIVRKIKIKHADPALIFLLLKGETTVFTEPEISSKPKKW
jgi:hypothetical protein